jgi:RHS repeat-associated protein
VAAPLGEITRMSYDVNGNRLWQQPDDDTTNTARRVTYTYWTATNKLLATVKQPVIGKPDSVWYDTMGNPDSTGSPTGIKSYFYKDALGRDTMTLAPADLSSNTWTRSRVWFNVADEDSVSRSWSPTYPDTITVTKTFDAEGNVLTHTTTLSVDPNGLGGMSHIFTYDRANRKIAEQPQGATYGTDHFTYDAAGNVTFWLLRSSVGVTTTYDALNRPVKKIIPGMSIGGIANYTFGTNIPDDTQTFVYDVAGNMVQANNLYARVKRSWNQNGTLAADTEFVRASLAEDPTYPHAYGIRYGYDIEGRRTWMKYPGAVAVAGYDSAAYTYDATTGVLRDVRDPYGHTFGFGYDNAMRLVRDSSLTELGQTPMVNVRTYDDESRVTTATMTRSATTLYTSTVNYSERSTIKSATFSVGGNGVATMKYHPLGPLTRAGDQSTFYNDSTEPDALGNAHRKLHYGSLTDVTTLTYEPGSAILDRSVTQHGLGSPTPDTTLYTYDLAGSTWTTTNLKFVYNFNCGGLCSYQIYSRTVNSMRYGADLKLMATRTHFDSLDELHHIVVGFAGYEEREEYRYDALGRRIWKRLVRPNTFCPKMDKASGCLSVVERTVWDGDQVLAEARADGGETAGAVMECDAFCNPARPALEGRVLYTLGGGLDHPLDIIRLDWYNDVIVPVYSWRGRAVTGYCVNSSMFCAQDFTWPAQTENAQFDDPPVTDPEFGGPVAWGGNIIDTQQDGSGLIYKRNRYYDPASGRFTQVDPIGLGGGLSAYGFGGGDQVSFTDPFGFIMQLQQASSPNSQEGPSAQDSAGKKDSTSASGKDACQVYKGSAAIKSICLSVYAPGKSDSATTCAAECLAKKYQDLLQTLGRAPTSSELGQYLLDHKACYNSCGMTIKHFIELYVQDAGNRARGTHVEYPGYYYNKVGANP